TAPPRRRAAKLAAIVLVATQAAWIGAGFVFPSLPGWTMFARFEKLPSTLVDKDGKTESLYDFVPKDVYVTGLSGARAIAAFACRRMPGRAPWRLLWKDGRAEYACSP
ncbi:MAG: hypothetical protein Q7J64_01165, partial [Elusimicrobiota bacterium]|nr:hypothetical protein [Elusimicrobiota bacterium]